MAALRVLTDRALLRLVFRFVPTAEQALAAFERGAWARVSSWLEDDGAPPASVWTSQLSAVAVFLDDREALELILHVNSCPRHGQVPHRWRVGRPVAAAIRYGCSTSLQWIADRLDHYGHPWRENPLLIRAAIARRDVAAMTWLLANVPRKDLRLTSELVDDAAEEGHLDVVRWIHDHRFNDAFSTRTMDVAAGAGRMDVVRFLSDSRSEGCTAEAMDRAATAGFLNVVKFLHNHRREGCSTQAMDGAAKYGHIEIVRFLHYQRREGCSPAALNYAATNGHFTVLKFLVEHRAEGCLFEARNCSLLRGFKEQADFLSSRIKGDLMLCSVRMHATPSWIHPRRRCQVTRATSDRALSDEDYDSDSTFPWCPSLAGCLK